MDWKKNAKHHIDLWTGPGAPSNVSALIACENGLTAMKDSWLVNPPATLGVDPAPLFNGTTNACVLPPEPCTDQGTVCGNECETPATESCTQLAMTFGLSLARFVALNPSLNCAGQIPGGTSVCQGGSCGG